MASPRNMSSGSYCSDTFTPTSVWYTEKASPLCRTLSLALVLSLVACMFFATVDGVSSVSDSKRRHDVLAEKLRKCRRNQVVRSIYDY
jgi:hypothetical protein